MKSLLTAQEALTLMKQTDKATGKPVPFRIVFVTADQRRKTGGEVIEFTRAVLCRRGDHDAKTSQAPARAASTGPRKPKKNGWMYLVQNLDSGAIRPVHYHLIAYLNDHSLR